MLCRPTPTTTADLAARTPSPTTRTAPGVPAIDPVRITVGQHHVLGLVASTIEDEPGVEHDLLTHAGFTLQPGDFLYTLPGNANDPAAVSAAVTDLRTGARALGIRMGIDPGLAAALNRSCEPQAEPAAGRAPATPDGPALTTAVPARLFPATAPHPIR